MAKFTPPPIILMMSGTLLFFVTTDKLEMSRITSLFVFSALLCLMASSTVEAAYVDVPKTVW